MFFKPLNKIKALNLYKNCVSPYEGKYILQKHFYRSVMAKQVLTCKIWRLI